MREFDTVEQALEELKRGKIILETDLSQYGKDIK